MSKVKLIFKREVYREIMAIASVVTTEVAGMCKCVLNEDGNYVAISNHVTEQDVHGTTAELRPEGLAKLEYDTMNLDGELWLWWHSHAGMGVTPSGQDVTQRRDIASTAGRCLAVIVNHNENISGVYCHKIDTGISGLPSYVEADIDITVYMSEEEAKLKERAKEIVKANVFKKVSTPVTYSSGFSRGTTYGYNGKPNPSGIVANAGPSATTVLKGKYYYDKRGAKLKCVLKEPNDAFTDVAWAKYFKEHSQNKKAIKALIKEFNDSNKDKGKEAPMLTGLDRETMLGEISCDRLYWAALYLKTYQMTATDDDLISFYSQHKDGNSSEYEDFLEMIQEDMYNGNQWDDQTLALNGVY